MTSETATLYSSSEIEALAVKAARGAGFDWGMAEEAGMAVRRLTEAGLPGAGLLLALLEADRGVAPDLASLTRWHSPSGRALCPLLSGSTLSDYATLFDGSDVILHRLGHPALILPFAAQVASRLNQSLRLVWRGADVIVDQGQLHPIRTDTLLAMAVDKVTVSFEASGLFVAEPRQTGGFAPVHVWQRLDQLALATTVPATGSSRANAGAGNPDND